MFDYSKYKIQHQNKSYTFNSCEKSKEISITSKREWGFF